MLVEDIPYEDTPHKTLLSPNLNLSQEGIEEEQNIEERKEEAKKT